VIVGVTMAIGVFAQEQTEPFGRFYGPAGHRDAGSETA
jgi:hypothetical protein